MKTVERKNIERKRMLLIDGSSMLVTNYFATKPKREENEDDESYYSRFLQSSDGMYTNALVTTLKTILTLIQKIKPDYKCIALDKTRNTFRREIYPEYKGNRKSTESPLSMQKELFYNILKYVGIPVLWNDRFEADDIIYTIVEQFKSTKGLSIDVVTKDHDYWVMADENVTIWMPQSSYDKATKLYEIFGYSPEERKCMPSKMFPYTVENIERELGLSYTLMSDYKGIVGDSSDNIPGVKGVSSAAVPLLKEWKFLEGVYAALEADKAAFIERCKEIGVKRNPANALIKYKDDAFMSKELATMKKVHLVCEITEIAFRLDLNHMQDISDEFEMKTLIQYINILKNQSNTGSLVNVAGCSFVNKSVSGLMEFFDMLFSNNKNIHLYSNVGVNDEPTPIVEQLCCMRDKYAVHFCEDSIRNDTDINNYFADLDGNMGKKAAIFIIDDNTDKSVFQLYLSAAERKKLDTRIIKETNGSLQCFKPILKHQNNEVKAV